MPKVHADPPKVPTENVDGSSLMVSLPLFHDDIVLLRNKCYEDKKPCLSKAQKFQDKNNWNWITEDLQNELELHFPEKDDLKKTGKNQG